MQDVYFTSEIQKKNKSNQLVYHYLGKKYINTAWYKKKSAAFSKPQNGDSKCPWETRTEYCFECVI